MERSSRILTGGKRKIFKIDRKDKEPIPDSCKQPLGSGHSKGKKKKLNVRERATVDIADDDSRYSSSSSDVEIVFEKKCQPTEVTDKKSVHKSSNKPVAVSGKHKNRQYSTWNKQDDAEKLSSSISSNSSVIQLDCSDMEDDQRNGAISNDVEMQDAPNESSASRSESFDWANVDASSNKDGNMDVILTDGEAAAEEDDSDNDLPDIEEIPTSYTKLDIATQRKNLGNDYFKRGEYHKALEMYSSAISAAPTEAAFFGNRAACLIMMKKFKDAVQDAKKAIELDPNLQNAYIRLVRSTLALGDVISCQAAIDQIKSNSTFTIDVSDEKSKLANLQQLRKEVTKSEAAQDYRRVLFLVERAREIAAGEVMLKIKRAEALVKLNRFSEAQDQCTDVLQTDGMVMEAITLRAYCFYHADNLEKSLQNYKQALQLAPDNNEAVAMYRRVKSIKELRELGATRFKARDWSAAFDTYQECLKLMKADVPQNKSLASKINFNLSMISNKIEPEKDSSLKYANAAIEMNPSYFKALIHRGQIYIKQEKYDEAVKDFEAADKLDPHNKEVRDALQESKKLAKLAKRKDYYKILGIDKKASSEEIKKAYKKRALDHHPDRHANASETERKDQEKKFKEVLEAYEILLDDKKRRKYDLGIDTDSYSGGGYNFEDQIFSNMFCQHPGMGSRQGFPQFRTGPGFSGYRH